MKLINMPIIGDRRGERAILIQWVPFMTCVIAATSFIAMKKRAIARILSLCYQEQSLVIISYVLYNVSSGRCFQKIFIKVDCSYFYVKKIAAISIKKVKGNRNIVRFMS